jgi:hypothetical protein
MTENILTNLVVSLEQEVGFKPNSLKATFKANRTSA